MRFALLWLAAALIATSAGAQLPTPPAAPGQPQTAADSARQKKRNETAAVDSSQRELTGYYVIPEIPATALLGATPASITRPATPKDFASAIVDGIGADGRVKQGIALEASLGLLKPFKVPLETYQRDWRARFFSNFLLSFATARVTGDTGSTDLGWGARAPLYDAGDPLSKPAWTARLGSAMERCAPVSPPDFIPPNTGLTQQQVDSQAKAIKPLIDALNTAHIGCLETAAEEIGKQAAESLWNAPRVILAYAGSLRFTNSEIDKRARLADRYWLSGAIPLSLVTGPIPFFRSSQAIGYVDYSHYRSIDTVKKYSAVRYGGRVNYGSSTANFFYELLGEARSDPPAGTKKNATGWSLGIEFLATQELWISTGFGKRAEELLKPDKTVLIANIRWGIAKKSFLNPP
jgi:hypothetical protein